MRFQDKQYVRSFGRQELPSSQILATFVKQ